MSGLTSKAKIQSLRFQNDPWKMTKCNGNSTIVNNAFPLYLKMIFPFSEAMATDWLVFILVSYLIVKYCCFPVRIVIRKGSSRKDNWP